MSITLLEHLCVFKWQCLLPVIQLNCHLHLLFEIQGINQILRHLHDMEISMSFLNEFLLHNFLAQWLARLSHYWITRVQFGVEALICLSYFSIKLTG